MKRTSSILSCLLFYYCKRSGCKDSIQYDYVFYIVTCEHINTKEIVRDENSVIRFYNRKWLPLASRLVAADFALFVRTLAGTPVTKNAYRIPVCHFDVSSAGLICEKRHAECRRKVMEL